MSLFHRLGIVKLADHQQLPLGTTFNQVILLEELPQGVGEQGLLIEEREHSVTQEENL